MKTVTELSERTRKKYALLARLSIPLEFRPKHSKYWYEFRNQPEVLADWLMLRLADNHGQYYVRRKPCDRSPNSQNTRARNTYSSYALAYPSSLNGNTKTSGAHG